jgi:1-acyl-sn-glycerol-3-phosphate acyltransferase
MQPVVFAVSHLPDLLAMHRLPFQTPPRWWPSKLSPTLVRLMRPIRLRRMRIRQRIVDVEIRGLERLKALLEEGAGVLIGPNHAGDGDVDAVYSVSDRVGRPFHCMAAWQVFIENGKLGAWLMQRHGAFSVDREGTDTRALKHSIQLLQEDPCPVLIFPEGEVYHLSDRVMPFRQGPAAIALMAARKSKRPIYVLPVGLKLFYVDDPTPKLLELMSRLESEAAHWRPRPDLPLTDRIYRLAEGALALKELEYLGHTCAGSVKDRVFALADAVLTQVEQKYAFDKPIDDFPDRVKRSRQHAISGMEQAEEETTRKAFADDLDDLFFVCQLFSYPGDYVAQQPTIERVAETMDKFEEDVIGRSRPEIRGDRRAVIALGEPIRVSVEKGKKDAAAALTQQMESSVQALLDEIGNSGNLLKASAVDRAGVKTVDTALSENS